MYEAIAFDEPGEVIGQGHGQSVDVAFTELFNDLRRSGNDSVVFDVQIRPSEES